MAELRRAWRFGRNGWSMAVVCLAALGAAVPASATPKIVVEKTRLEIGEVTAGDARDLEFPFSNTGTEPLKIERVTVSCGCTTTSFPTLLQPGEKGSLKVKFASYPLWSGPVEKHLTIMSNDPVQPSVNLAFVAQMRPLLRISPENPYTANYKKGDVIRQVFTITSAVEPPITISGAEPVTGGAEVQILPTDSSAAPIPAAPILVGPVAKARLLPAQKGDKPGAARVEVTVHPPDNGGDFSTQVLLTTSHPKAPTFPLVIHGISQAGITVSPSVLYLGPLSAAAESSLPRFVTIFRRTGNFRVLEVKADAPELQADVRQIPDSNLAEILVKYRGGWQPGKHTGKLTITTDDPEQKTLVIPYEGTVN